MQVNRLFILHNCNYYFLDPPNGEGLGQVLKSFGHMQMLLHKSERSNEAGVYISSQKHVKKKVIIIVKVCYI